MMISLMEKVTAKSKRLEADGRKLLFEVCVMQEDRVIGKGLRRRTILKGTG
jgi:predicted thioesterase